MLTTDFIPTFETDRLLLRGATAEDLDRLDQFFSSEESKYLGGPRPRLDTWEGLCAAIGHWILRGFGLWMVADKADGTVYGIAGLQQPDGWPEPELICVIFSAYTGRGLGKEVVQAVRRISAREYGILTPLSLLYLDYQEVIDHAEMLGAVRIEDVVIPEGPVPAWRFPELDEDGDA